VHLKATVLGVLIYAAMLAHLGAGTALVRRWRRAGRLLYGAGFALAAAAFGVRLCQVGHLPLDNLFGVFLCLGMLSWPLAVFARRALGVEATGADAFIGALVLFPAGFVFTAEPRTLATALRSWLFAPHILAYMLGYVVMAKAGVQAWYSLRGCAHDAEGRRAPHETATFRLIRFGFPLLTLGLILGAVWGQRAWGDYWNWDPKELWGLAMWLVYVAYFQVRHMFGERAERVCNGIALGGVGVIIITLLWVNLSRLFAGLHSYAR